MLTSAFLSSELISGSKTTEETEEEEGNRIREKKPARLCRTDIAREKTAKGDGKRKQDGRRQMGGEDNNGRQNEYARWRMKVAGGRKGR